MSDERRTPQQVFEEQITQKLRVQFEELMPDELLTALIEKSIKEIFFKERPSTNYYSSSTRPSFFVEAVETALRRHVNDVIAKFFENNQEQISKLIEDTLVKNIAGLFTVSLHSMFSQMGNNIYSQLTTNMYEQVDKHVNELIKSRLS